MILGSGLPKAYWGEVALYVEYILNHTHVNHSMVKLLTRSLQAKYRTFG